MNIYVGNIAQSVSEDTLVKAFEKFGQVKSAKILKDRDSGVSRGFGFVEMPNQEEAKQAINAMNKQELEGQLLRVNEAREKDENRPARFGSSGPRSSGGGFGSRNSSGNGGGWRNNNRY